MQYYIQIGGGSGELLQLGLAWVVGGGEVGLSLRNVLKKKKKE